MRSTLLHVAITTFVLCGPALADPSAKPPAAPAPAAGDPATMLRLTLVVKSSADARTHELTISDRGCGSIQDKTTAYEDQLRVCSRPTASGLLLDTEWSTRAGAGEYRTRGELLLARAGGTGEVGRTGGHRLAVTVR